MENTYHYSVGTVHHLPLPSCAKCLQTNLVLFESFHINGRYIPRGTTLTDYRSAFDYAPLIDASTLATLLGHTQSVAYCGYVRRPAAGDKGGAFRGQRVGVV